MTDGLDLMDAIERIAVAYNEHLKIPQALTGHQAKMLMRLGSQEMTVGELTLSGCYLGSNVTYNLRKMVEAGWINVSPSRIDKRITMVKLSVSGSKLRDKLLERHHRFMMDFPSAAGVAGVIRFAKNLPIRGK